MPPYQFLRAFSILKKIRKFSVGNFRLGRARSIRHRAHSFTGPSFSLHQATRCLGKLLSYFLEHVFRCFPAKQILIIGICGYEKSDICILSSF